MSRGDDVTVNVVTGDGHGNVVQAGSVAGGIHFHGARSRPGRHQVHRGNSTTSPGCPLPLFPLHSCHRQVHGGT
jgi:hypothetical protein